MKLIHTCSTPLNRASFAGLPDLSQLLGQLGDCRPGYKIAVDGYQDKDAYHANFELPGVKKENVKIELKDDVLTVSAEKTVKTSDGESTHSLSRSISLPDGVNAEAITAKFEDGVLQLTLPKAEQRKARYIELN